MAAVAKTDYIPVEEYFRIDRGADERSDYFDGEMFNMAGGTENHSAIKTNLISSLVAQLKGKSCRPFDSDFRVKASASSLRIYPDASVFCESIEYDEEDSLGDTAINPAALFEVLSDSTEQYDRGLKFESFREVASMKAYVLIAQKYPGVDVFEKNDRGAWEIRTAIGVDSSIGIPKIGVTLDLADLYDRIEFEEERKLP